MKSFYYMAVGSELLEGVKQESNLLTLARAIEDRDAEIVGAEIIPDNSEAIETSLKRAVSSNVDYIVVSGGLGPTDDDITRESVAHLLGTKLILDNTCWEEIVEKFKKRGLPVAERNKKQAMIPEGMKAVRNPAGTACGFYGEVNGKILIVLPGVPVEFKEMLFTLVESLLPLKRSENLLVLRLFGISESGLNELLEKTILKIYPDLKLTFLPDYPEIELRIRFTTVEEDELKEELRRVVGNYVYSWKGEILPVVFGKELKWRGLFFAVAESCTGGLVAKSITDIPGSSEYFDRGFVTYSNQAKMDHLGVREETLRKFGAVSEETAREMVLGVLEHSRADIAASITGIAGPTGGTPEKPVGTVYTAIADREGRIEVVRNFFPGNREQVRKATMTKVLFGVVKWLERFYPL